MARFYISVGANLGDRAQSLRKAIDCLRRTEGVAVACRDEASGGLLVWGSCTGDVRIGVALTGEGEFGVDKAIHVGIKASVRLGNLKRSREIVLQPAGAVDAGVEQHPALLGVGHVVCPRGEALAHVVFQRGLYARDPTDGACGNKLAHAGVAGGEAGLHRLHKERARLASDSCHLAHLIGGKRRRLLAENGLARAQGPYRPDAVEAVGEGEVDRVDVGACEKGLVRCARLAAERLVGKRICGGSVELFCKGSGFGSGAAADGCELCLRLGSKARGKAVCDAPCP